MLNEDEARELREWLALDDVLATVPPPAETARTTVSPRPLRGPVDPERSRKGKNARRLGVDQERRIERVYGPRKVGEYGDAIDHLGATFKWQAKATREAPPAWLAMVTEPVSHLPWAVVAASMRAMQPLRQDLYPLVVTSFVRRQGPRHERTRDWVWVMAHHWGLEHGRGPWWYADPFDGWIVMSGPVFLDIHGRDTP